MSAQEKTRVLLKGTAILAAAALISKLLGVIYRIPYQNITGDLGFYVYQQVYPLYSLLLILATAGFPIAISKLVAERIALGDDHGAKRIFKVSSIVLSVTGVFFFFVLYASAPGIAAWIEDPELIMPIRSVAYALLVVPIMAAIRGYFQGHQNMVPTAVSQVVEQIVRVATILILSYWFIHNDYGVYYAGAGAVFGAFTGAIAALMVLLFFFKKDQSTTMNRSNNEDGLTEESKKLAQAEFSQLSNWYLMKRILYYAIPICLGALVLPLFQLVDTLSVVKLLIHSNWEHEMARVMKGVFDRGQPLIQFAAFFATALSLALVPAISEANAKKDYQLIAARSEIAMRITLFLGLAASVGLAVIAEPVNIMLYKTNEGSLTLAVLAFTTIFSTLGLASGAILQGLGNVFLPARNLFFGVLLKTLLNILLIPIWGITGAAIATVAAYSLATGLNLVALHKLTRLQVSFSNFFAKPLLAVVSMGLGVWLTKLGLTNAFAQVLDSERLLYTIVSLPSVLIGAIIYAVCLLRFGAITRKEIVSIPKVNKLVPLFDRLKILK